MAYESGVADAARVRLTLAPATSASNSALPMERCGRRAVLLLSEGEGSIQSAWPMLWSKSNMLKYAEPLGLGVGAVRAVSESALLTPLAVDVVRCGARGHGKSGNREAVTTCCSCQL